MMQQTICQNTHWILVISNGSVKGNFNFVCCTFNHLPNFFKWLCYFYNQEKCFTHTHKAWQSQISISQSFQRPGVKDLPGRKGPAVKGNFIGCFSLPRRCSKHAGGPFGKEPELLCLYFPHCLAHRIPAHGTPSGKSWFSDTVPWKHHIFGSCLKEMLNLILSFLLGKPVSVVWQSRNINNHAPFSFPIFRLLLQVQKIKERNTGASPLIPQPVTACWCAL